MAVDNRPPADCKVCGEKAVTTNFCGKCGAKIETERRCVSCGKLMVEGNLFCGNCGTKYESFADCEAPEAPKVSEVSEATEVSEVMHKSKPVQNVIIEGKTITFGPFNWRVLSVLSDSALIITEDIIEQRPYDLTPMATSWQTSALRDYLNGDFLENFSEEEQARIIEKRNSNPRNQWYDGSSNNRDTDDKVFLLSTAGADFYFGNTSEYENHTRKKYDKGKYIQDRSGSFFSNSHNKNRQANYEGSPHMWWLRSPGYFTSHATNVGADGAVNVFGSDVSRFGYLDTPERGVVGVGGVRPVLWLKIR